MIIAFLQTFVRLVVDIEQTYEMTDHQMTSQSVNGEQSNNETKLQSEQTSQQVMAAVH
ncbi:hypothetical protein IR133_06910 [Staphylococcus saprophyticus]|nr:hypothetical protein [Staphylococcus saprophyticus]